MRICFIGNFTGGGTEKATFLVANALANEHKIFLLNTRKAKPFFPLSGIEMDYLEPGSIPKRNISFFRYIRKNKINLVITVEAMTGIISLLPAKLAGCKHIVWEHANYYQTQGSKYIQKIRQLELKLANAYIVLTKRDLKNFTNHFKVKCKLDYIYNVAQPIQDITYNTDSKIIMSAGHIHRIKQFNIIPDIGKIVFSRYPNWKWNIYGDTSGTEINEIASKIKKYGLENNIILCGRCNDLSVEYKKNSMYIMTSLHEGLPMVLLEAKAHKLPLISFDIETGPDEIIRDGINGYLVEPYNIKSMAEKIICLIQNDMLIKEFSNNSVLDLEKFDIQTIVKKWREVIDEL